MQKYVNIWRDPLVFTFMKAILRCFAMSLLLSVAISAEERRTVVAPLPSEEILKPCAYRLVIPDEQRPVRAVWVIFDRGQDYLKWYLDPGIRTFAGEHALGLLLAAHCRSKEREDMIIEPSKGVGRALFTALEQFGESAHRGELKRVPARNGRKTTLGSTSTKARRGPLLCKIGRRTVAFRMHNR
jgi:hypothetical protein